MSVRIKFTMFVFAVGFIFSVTSMKSGVSASALSGVKREHLFENQVASFGRVIAWPGDKNVPLEHKKNLEKEQVVEKYSAPDRGLTRLGMGHEKQHSVGSETTEQNLVKRVLGKSSQSPGGSWMNSLGLKLPSLTPGRKKKGTRTSESQKEQKEPSEPKTPLKKTQDWLAANILYKKRVNENELRIQGTKYRTLPWVKPREKASPSPLEHKSTFDNRILKQDLPPELRGPDRSVSGQISGLSRLSGPASWTSEDLSLDGGHTPQKLKKARHRRGDASGIPPKVPSKKVSWASKEKARDNSKASPYIETPSRSGRSSPYSETPSRSGRSSPYSETPSRSGRSSPYSETPSRSSPWKTWVPKFVSKSRVSSNRIPTIPDLTHEHILSTTVDGKYGFISSEKAWYENDYHIPPNEPLPQSVLPVDLNKFLKGKKLDSVINAEELESYSTNQLSNDDINTKFNELLKRRHESFTFESVRNDPTPPPTPDPPSPPAPPVQHSTGSTERKGEEQRKEKAKLKGKLLSFNEDNSGLCNRDINKIYHRLSSRVRMESPEVEAFGKAEDNFSNRSNPGSSRNESPGSPKREHSGSPKRGHSGSPKRGHSGSPKREHSGSPKREHSGSPRRKHSGSARRKSSSNRGTSSPDHSSDSEKVREENKEIEHMWGQLKERFSKRREEAAGYDVD